MKYHEIDPSTVYESIVPDFTTQSTRSDKSPTETNPASIVEDIHEELLRKMQERRK